MDLRRERRAIERQFRRHEWQNRDTSVQWFVYDSVDSTVNDVYDSGPSRVWKTPVNVPILWIHRVEGADSLTDLGLEIYADIQLLISRDTWDSMGFGNPELRKTLSDLFLWETTLFTVISAEPQARLLLGTDSSVVVSANQANMNEFYQDVIPGLINSL